MSTYDTEAAGAAARYTNTAALNLPPPPPNMNSEQSANFAASVAAGHPQVSEPSVISTDAGRSVLNGAIDKHNTDMTNLRASQNPVPTDTGKKDTGTSDATNYAMKSVGGVTAEEAKATGLDLSGYNYDSETGYFLPSAGTKEQQAQFAGDKQSINDAFASQIQGMDAATQSLIGSIKGIYDDRIAAEQDVNNRELAGFNTMNIREGTSRYAGGVAQSILTADERVGLDRIKTIAHEMANQIAQANDNLTAKKYTAFMDNRNAIDKLTTERNKTLQDLQDKAVTEQKAQNDKFQAAQRDSTISQLMEKGVTDPADILAALNANGGQYNAKDVKDALTNLSPTDNYKDLSGVTKDFFVLKNLGKLPASIASLPEGKQLFAYLKQEKQASTIPAAGKNQAGLTPTQQAAKDEQDAASKDLTDAEAAISAGKDPNAVRRKFIDTHPKSASLYDKYFNAPNKSKNPYPTAGTSTGITF